MGAEARRSLYEYCRLNQKQYLLDEWDDGRNLPLTPPAPLSHRDLSIGSQCPRRLLRRAHSKTRL